MVDDLAHVVAAVNLVFNLTENLTNFVFNGVRPGCLLLEAMKVGKELPIDKVAEIVAGQGLVVVEFTILVLGRGPALPAVWLVEDEGVFLPLQLGLHCLVLLQTIQIFQEQQP